MSDKPMTKAELKSHLAEKAGISKEQSTHVLDALFAISVEQLQTIGSFSIPGLVKLTKSVKAATPERQGINPFTKEPITVKAKPAKNVVKAKLLKDLKDSV